MNYLSGRTSVEKNNDKEKYVYTGYGITFDSAGSWSFDNGIARMFDVDNSSSSHADNFKNNFLVLGEDPTFTVNRMFGSPDKMFSINFSKGNRKFCLSFHYNGNNSHLFVNPKTAGGSIWHPHGFSKFCISYREAETLVFCDF